MKSDAAAESRGSADGSQPKERCVTTPRAASSATPPPAKSGAVYPPRGGVCFETQFAPDAVHHPDFASPVLRAGEKYDQTSIYRFSVE